ncbi:MAG: PDZ domain-containing protein [Planctomycetes bacterium]|jgi:serine protease Do|nr:PDZ domain-containing protein [Planctomycetota bacterium]
MPTTTKRRPHPPPLAASRKWLAALLIAASGVLCAPALAGVDSRHRPPRPHIAGPWAAFAPVAAEARRSVVAVRVGRERVALATLIDTEGHALTKASELPAEGALRVEIAPGKSVPAQRIGADQPTDLALLRLHTRQLPPIALGPADGDEATDEGLSPGTWLISVAPGRTPLAAGIISVEPRAIAPRRVLIGVEIRPGGDDGPRIRSVIPGMGADKAGLKPGDIITRVGGQETNSRDDVVTRLKGLSEGDAIEVKVRRGDEQLSFTIDLAPLPESLFDRSAHMNRMGGELSERVHGFERVIQHDTVLAPHEVGGPVVDLDGRVVGLNIARAGRIASYALPMDLCLAAAKRIRQRAEPIEQPVHHESHTTQ